MSRNKERGQSLVEFALVLPVLLLFMLGIVDGGRAIFAYNQMSQLTRDVARVASVSCFETSPRCDWQTAGTPIANAIAAHSAGLQGPVTWTVQCIDRVTYAVHDLDPGGSAPFCAVGDLVRVNAVQSFNLLYGPLAADFGTVGVASTSDQQILQ